MSSWDLTCGDVATVLREQRDMTFDACVCDPPYGLSFMGNRWDYAVPSVETWREVFRVLKPGAPLLSFSGTRTQHRMAVNIEEAGFDVEDTIAWLYGQGKPATRYRLKPAHEPIILARRPVRGTIAFNLKEWGVGGLSIDSCRIPTKETYRKKRGSFPFSDDAWGKGRMTHTESHPGGRWPANVILDPIAAAMLDAQSGTLKSHGHKTPLVRGIGYGSNAKGAACVLQGDEGGASRFFYCAKAKGAEANDNPHPTKKPVALTTYLAKLVLPEKPGAIVIPYAGSGSEMIGALAAGWPMVFGIEREAAYVAIAERRLSDATAA